MQKSVEKGRDKNACLQISRDSQGEQFFLDQQSQTHIRELTVLYLLPLPT